RPTPPDTDGLLGKFSIPRRITDANDGSSNPILIVEEAGRPILYVKRQAYGAPLFTPPPGYSPFLNNSAWADYNTKVDVDGTDPTGSMPGRGCCVINCLNYDEIYAFHAGGANVLRADGSVAFISEGIAAATLGSLISANGGGVVPA